MSANRKFAFSVLFVLVVVLCAVSTTFVSFPSVGASSSVNGGVAHYSAPVFVMPAVGVDYKEDQTFVEYWEGFGDGYCMNPITPMSMPNPNPDICGKGASGENVPAATDDSDVVELEVVVLVVVVDEPVVVVVTPEPTKEKSNNGNHYGNDKPDNNDKDNSKFNGADTRADFDAIKDQGKDNGNGKKG